MGALKIAGRHSGYPLTADIPRKRGERVKSTQSGPLRSTLCTGGKREKAVFTVAPAGPAIVAHHRMVDGGGAAYLAAVPFRRLEGHLIRQLLLRFGLRRLKDVAAADL
jgi:hypothetical protein